MFFRYRDIQLSLRCKGFVVPAPASVTPTPPPLRAAETVASVHFHVLEGPGHG